MSRELIAAQIVFNILTGKRSQLVSLDPLEANIIIDKVRDQLTTLEDIFQTGEQTLSQATTVTWNTLVDLTFTPPAPQVA